MNERLLHEVRGFVCVGENLPNMHGHEDTEKSEGILECSVCSNAFELPPRNWEGGVDRKVDLSFSHIPKLLAGCLHTVCQSCAEEALQRSSLPTVLPCPICSVPTPGVSTTSSLTDNVIALQEARRRSRNCDFCDDVVDASRRCVNCESILCAFHVKHHARSRATKAHKILPIKARSLAATRSSASDAYHAPIFCPRHDGVPAKLFCSEPCGQVMCYECSVGDHSGHSVLLADSPELEAAHRTRLTRHAVNLRHRLAAVQIAVTSVASIRTGIEQSTRTAEKAALQAFDDLRRAVNMRQKAMLKVKGSSGTLNAFKRSRHLLKIVENKRRHVDKAENPVVGNLRRARVSKTQHLVDQLRVLNETVRNYTTALRTTDHCLDSLRGDQLIAMEPALRWCLEKHEAEFTSLPLESCADDRLEFVYDKDVATAIRAGISKLGGMASAETDFKENDGFGQTKCSKQKTTAQGVQSTPPRVHFTLAARAGGASDGKCVGVGFSSSKSDTVVVEMRHGSEEEFLATGAEGPVIGRVVLDTKLEGAKYLQYESEQFFESLSRRALSTSSRQASGTGSRDNRPNSLPADSIPAVRFTKRLRVAGRLGVDWDA